MSSIQDLMRILAEESSFIDERNNYGQSELTCLLEEVIAQTMKEIKNGANSEDFADLVIINLIIKANQQGFTPNQIRRFVAELSRLD